MNRVVAQIGEWNVGTLIRVGVSALLVAGFTLLGASATAEQSLSRPKQFSVQSTTMR